MIKQWKKIAVGMVAVLMASLTFALGALVCPIDHTHMTWTGNTREEGGKKLAEYTCVQGHTTWVVIN